jgi:hypothetical protein
LVQVEFHLQTQPAAAEAVQVRQQTVQQTLVVAVAVVDLLLTRTQTERLVGQEL